MTHTNTPGPDLTEEQAPLLKFEKNIVVLGRCIQNGRLERAEKMLGKLNDNVPALLDAVESAEKKLPGILPSPKKAATLAALTGAFSTLGATMAAAKAAGGASALQQTEMQNALLDAATPLAAAHAGVEHLAAAADALYASGGAEKQAPPQVLLSLFGIS